MNRIMTLLEQFEVERLYFDEKMTIEEIAYKLHLSESDVVTRVEELKDFIKRNKPDFYKYWEYIKKKMTREERTEFNAGQYAIGHYEFGKTYDWKAVHKMLCDAYIEGQTRGIEVTADKVYEFIRKNLKNESYIENIINDLKKELKE